MFKLLKRLYKPNKETVKAIIWDVDGTFYRNEKLAMALKNEFINYLAEVLGKPRETVSLLFEEESKRCPCWSKTVEVLSGVDESQVILAIEEKVDKSRYLEKDGKLVKVFEKLKDFRHLILTNSRYKNTVSTLRALGFSPKSEAEVNLEFPPFEKIFAFEQTKTIKPRKEALLKVLDYTKLSPEKHLLVGDIADVDIIPARQLGMKTCLVWGHHPLAEINLANIYQFPSIFLKSSGS